jgi:hypothetical protein
MQDTIPPRRSTDTDTDTDRDAAAVATETSPSAGWREVAHALHAPDAHAVEEHPTPDERLNDVDVTAEDAAAVEVAG